MRPFIVLSRTTEVVLHVAPTHKEATEFIEGFREWGDCYVVQPVEEVEDLHLGDTEAVEQMKREAKTYEAPDGTPYRVSLKGKTDYLVYDELAREVVAHTEGFVRSAIRRCQEARRTRRFVYVYRSMYGLVPDTGDELNLVWTPGMMIDGKVVL